MVLTALFALAGTGRGPSSRQIVAGQYLGIGMLVAASALAAFGLLLLPEEGIRWLGVIPLALGLVGLVRALRGSDGEEPPEPLPARTGALGVAAITVANGGDNIAVYVPFFASEGAGAIPVIVAVFALLTGVWCLAARALAGRPTTLRAIDAYGHWLVPLVLIALGVVILA